MTVRAPMLALMAALSLATVGCAALASLFGPSPSELEAQRVADEEASAEAAAEAEAARQAQAQRDQALVAELDGARAAATGEGAGLDAILAYADKFTEAHEAGLTVRGLVAPEIGVEVEAALAEQREVHGADVAAISLRQGRVLAALGRPDEAAARWLETLGFGAPPGVFEALVGLAPSPATDAAVVEACGLVRGSVDGAAIPSFVELCLARAHGDRTKLRWPEAKRDLGAYDDELRRREQEAAQLAAAEAAAEAEAAAKRGQQAVAAVFAAGRCRFSDCAKEGWELSTDAGTIRTTCRFSDCFKEGWDTEFPDGGRATTRCRFSDCAKEGWDTELPGGARATTRCRFSDCFKEGWDTEFPDGGRAATRCRFSKCFEEGWDTELPEGGRVQCRCRFSNCLEEGTQCD